MAEALMDSLSHKDSRHFGAWTFNPTMQTVNSIALPMYRSVGHAEVEVKTPR